MSRRTGKKNPAKSADGKTASRRKNVLSYMAGVILNREDTHSEYGMSMFATLISFMLNAIGLLIFVVAVFSALTSLLALAVSLYGILSQGRT